MRITVAIRSWVVLGSLLGSALCVPGCYDSEQPFGGESHFLRACERTAQCSDLGAGYTCVEGHCQADQAAAEISSGGDGATSGTTGSESSTANPGDGDPSASSGTLSEATPLVLLLVDTSGSMARTTGCSCDTPSCEKCLPDCSKGEQDRWTQLLEVLTGTFDGFSCEALERTAENGASYDIGYYLPYNRPAGEQRADGLLDSYRDRLRFGVATFDGYDSYVGAAPLVAMSDFDFETSAGLDGLWSYNPQREIPDLQSNATLPVGSFRYPNEGTELMMDTGIRNADAAEGALRVASDPTLARATNDAIQASLLGMRPYGGTPIAAALDDLYYFLAQDPTMAAERTRSAPRHVVLITDGYPDDDYRSLGCNCAHESDPVSACGSEDPALNHCPYPTPEEAARALRCGRDASRCDVPQAQLHVIAFAVDDTLVQTRLDAIAVAGGGQGAHLVDSKLELREALDSVLHDIAQ